MIDGIKLGNLLIDCKNAEELCDFYHGLLGGEKNVLFGLPALCSGNLLLLFATEADYAPPVWPETPGSQQKQMHFDFQVPDVSLAVNQAKALGATVAGAQFGNGHFVTMMDPAGHPFCLCSESNPF